MAMINLEGQRFGRWTVMYKTDKRTKSRLVIWHCKCDCGNEKDVDGYTLRSRTVSILWVSPKRTYCAASKK